MAISLLIADDHTLVREGLRNFFELEGDLKIVGEAETGEEAVAQVEQLQPQVVIMDLSMPGEGGIAATEVITSKHPEVKVIALTMHDDVGYLLEAIKAGAMAFLLKDVNPKEIIGAIRIVAAGGAYLPPRLLQELFREVARLLSKKEDPKDGWDALSKRERQVLSLVAEGQTNPEIAENLFISPRTVKNHVSNILHKLDLPDRTQAALLAHKMGLIEND